MLLLVLAFVVVPLVELYAIIQVGEAIGVLPTVALLLADSLLGAALMRSQGRAAWRRLTAATSAGRLPTREMIDGGLVIFGGALLLTPGFVTDLLGFALLLPPTRALIRPLLVARLGRRVLAGAASLPGRAPGDAWRGPAGTVDGTAHEIHDPPAQLP